MLIFIIQFILVIILGAIVLFILSKMPQLALLPEALEKKPNAMRAAALSKIKYSSRKVKQKARQFKAVKAPYAVGDEREEFDSNGSYWKKIRGG